MDPNTGYIYLLTNPAFKGDWVKIGKSSQFPKGELDNPAMPLPYEVYATLRTAKYEVAFNTAEKQIRKEVARLNPESQMRQNQDFFNIKPGVASAILQDIAVLLDDAEFNLGNGGLTVVSPDTADTPNKEGDKDTKVIFELNLNPRPRPQLYSDEELLADIRRVTERLGQNFVTPKNYATFGKYNMSTLQARFGSWREACKKAGFAKPPNQHVISEEELLKNLQTVWQELGRLPMEKEMKKPLSLYHATTYQKRFGSWYKALQRFAEKQSIPLSQLPPKINIAAEELLENLKTVWETLGRLPSAGEMKKPFYVAREIMFREKTN